MLFGKKDREEGPAAKKVSRTRPLVGKEVFCRVCNKPQSFSRCWMRVDQLAECTDCGLAFPDPAQVYRQTQPVCPRCEEYLEHPGFEYGICDGCGSKFELTAGTKPGLLPNRQQRAEMNKSGKVWRKS